MQQSCESEIALDEFGCGGTPPIEQTGVVGELAWSYWCFEAGKKALREYSC